MARKYDPYLRGYPMDPRWEDGDPLDPNWSEGRYHGMRMRPVPGQAAYGFHRMARERDLLGHGGFQGVYDEGPGRFDEHGAFRHPRLEGQGGPRRRLGQGHGEPAPRRVEDGGVRGEAGYLRQYNAESPMLRDGRAEERGFGWAPAGGRDGEYGGGEPRERATDERGYAGYNQGGFAGEQGPGLDPRR
jgi:hypothetical protein